MGKLMGRLIGNCLHVEFIYIDIVGTIFEHIFIGHHSELHFQKYKGSQAFSLYIQKFLL